jgi:hypothetical protein
MNTNYIRRVGITLSTLTLVAVGVAACAKKDADQTATAGAGREIQLAPTTTAQPQLNDAPEPKAPAPRPKPAPVKRPVEQPRDVVVNPLPAAPKPAPLPAAPAAPVIGTIATGTSFSVRPSAQICTNTFKAGDRFTTATNETITGSNGATIPAGTPVVLRVVESARSEDSKDNIKLSFDVVSLKMGDESYEVMGSVAQTAPLQKVRAQSTTKQAEKIGAGAAIGAIAGQLLGKNTKGTLIGAAVGAAAGGAVAAGTADYDGCVAAGSSMNVALTAPLRIKVIK